MKLGVYGIFKGIVENTNDPQKRGRLKIRVGEFYGTDGKRGMSTESLPWARPMSPTLTDPPLPVGSVAWVMFEQGNTAYPVYMGYMLKYNDCECYSCKHLVAARRCTAFPGGIPDEIYFGDVKHDKSYSKDGLSDNGIIYERK